MQKLKCLLLTAVFTLSVSAAALAYEVPKHAIPAGGAALTVGAENYDDGGEGVAYQYASTDASRARELRADEKPAIEKRGDAWNIGWTSGGDWFNYTVEFPSDGKYGLTIEGGSGGSGDFILGVEVDGKRVVENVSTPVTGDWGKFITVDMGTFNATKGSHVVKVVLENGNVNFQSFDIKLVEATAGNAQTGEVSFILLAAAALTLSLAALAIIRKKAASH